MGISPQTRCAMFPDRMPSGPYVELVPFITKYTRASWGSPGSVIEGVVGFILTPFPFHMQRSSLPGMICTSLPVSTCRISMKHELNKKI